MPSIASLLRPSKSTSNLKAAAAGSSTPPPQFNAFQTDIVKRPFLTLATPSAGTPSTPVSTSLLSASLKCLESEIPEPFYAIRTKEHLSVIWRRDFRLGRVKVGSIRWPRRGGYVNGQGPSSETQDEGVRIRFAGKEHIGVESLLDPPSKSGSRKFHIPHLGHPIKWKQHGAAGSGVYWCTCPGVKGPIATLETPTPHHLPRFKLTIYETLYDPDENLSSYRGVSLLLLDYIIVTSLLLITPTDEWSWIAEVEGYARGQRDGLSTVGLGLHDEEDSGYWTDGGGPGVGHSRRHTLIQPPTQPFVRPRYGSNPQPILRESAVLLEKPPAIPRAPVRRSTDVPEPAVLGRMQTFKRRVSMWAKHRLQESDENEPDAGLGLDDFEWELHTSAPMDLNLPKHPQTLHGHTEDDHDRHSMIGDEDDSFCNTTLRELQSLEIKKAGRVRIGSLGFRSRAERDRVRALEKERKNQKTQDKEKKKDLARSGSSEQRAGASTSEQQIDYFPMRASNHTPRKASTLPPAVPPVPPLPASVQIQASRPMSTSQAAPRPPPKQRDVDEVLEEILNLPLPMPDMPVPARWSIQDRFSIFGTPSQSQKGGQNGNSDASSSSVTFAPPTLPLPALPPSGLGFSPLLRAQSGRRDSTMTAPSLRLGVPSIQSGHSGRWSYGPNGLSWLPESEGEGEEGEDSGSDTPPPVPPKPAGYNQATSPTSPVKPTKIPPHSYTRDSVQSSVGSMKSGTTGFATIGHASVSRPRSVSSGTRMKTKRNFADILPPPPMVANSSNPGEHRNGIISAHDQAEKTKNKVKTRPTIIPPLPTHSSDVVSGGLPPSPSLQSPLDTTTVQQRLSRSSLNPSPTLSFSRSRSPLSQTTFPQEVRRSTSVPFLAPATSTAADKGVDTPTSVHFPSHGQWLSSSSQTSAPHPPSQSPTLPTVSPRPPSRALPVVPSGSGTASPTLSYVSEYVTRGSTSSDTDGNGQDRGEQRSERNAKTWSASTYDSSGHSGHASGSRTLPSVMVPMDVGEDDEHAHEVQIEQTDEERVLAERIQDKAEKERMRDQQMTATAPRSPVVGQSEAGSSRGVRTLPPTPLDVAAGRWVGVNPVAGDTTPTAASPVTYQQPHPAYDYSVDIRIR